MRPNQYQYPNCECPLIAANGSQQFPNVQIAPESDRLVGKAPQNN